MSPVAVVLVDTENIVTSWNPAAERLFGYTADEAIGQYVVDLVAKDPSLIEDAEENSRKVREGNPVHAFTLRSRKDGKMAIRPATRAVPTPPTRNINGTKGVRRR